MKAASGKRIKNLTEVTADQPMNKQHMELVKEPNETDRVRN